MDPTFSPDLSAGRNVNTMSKCQHSAAASMPPQRRHNAATMPPQCRLNAVHPGPLVAKHIKSTISVPGVRCQGCVACTYIRVVGLVTRCHVTRSCPMIGSAPARCDWLLFSWAVLLISLIPCLYVHHFQFRMRVCAIGIVYVMVLFLL